MAFYISQHVGRHSSWVSHCEGPFHRYLSRLDAHDCAFATFNHFAVER